MTMRTGRISALLLALATAGCGDVLSLEERPQTFLAEEQFYRNADDAEAATLAAYAPFQEKAYYGFRLITNLLSMEDSGDGRGSYAPGATYACNQTCKGRLWDAWSAMYRGINRANLGIARIPEIAMGEAARDRLVAELHFIRALNYYNLVRYWGGVPLRVEPSAGYESLAAPRASVEEVYQQVISDLQLAESRLPETADNGRATRWAAKALLADVYLARENWAQAAAKAKEVIDSGRFSLVQVARSEDFDRVFGPTVVTSSEEIFDIPFVSQNPFGTQLPSALQHANSGYAARAYYGVFVDPKAAYVREWDRSDLRYAYNLYVGNETRLLTPALPQFFKKFKDRSATDRSGHGNDFPVVRYADVLLIFAEATAMASAPNAAAYDAVNQVRRRAYGQPLGLAAPGADVPAGLGQQAFRDAVLLERGYEFFSEGKRYWDLKRTGRLEAAIRAVGEPYDPKYMLWPLPEEELDANEALTLADQNPGW
jgi:hypothetical protein